MTIGDRERLIGRIRQIRRAATPEPPPRPEGEDVPLERVAALEDRVAHLERLLEGLQDSVHRESERHAGLIAELQARVEPAAMGAALAEHNRDRGL